ncbi:hypothetical protein [Streptomyces sp. NPDC101181]|uniref:hypothetical protein n=1 Tax=Streptomyces sp. NPDC101181 TaxID=3366125 RepID=UPI00380578AF
MDQSGALPAEAHERPDDDLDDDEDLAVQAADALSEAFLERFEMLDAEAVADENSFWHVAAEELGYGMNV